MPLFTSTPCIYLRRNEYDHLYLVHVYLSQDADPQQTKPRKGFARSCPASVAFGSFTIQSHR